MLFLVERSRIHQYWSALMSSRKKEKTTISGSCLLARGDVIQVMEQGTPVKCKVISSILAGDGACLATLEVIEGEKKGQRITSKLRADKQA
jgi:hypothetical protein